MKTLKLIGNCSFFFLGIFGFILSLIYGYYHFFVHNTTIGTNYISDQVPIDLVERADDLTSEEIEYYENRVLFEVNYFSNAKENGKQVSELNLSYFTDTSLTVNSCRATGMQHIGKLKKPVSIPVGSEDEADEFVSDSYYYYDTVDMISYNGGRIGTQLNRDEEFIIKIDNKPYLLQLTGYKKSTSGWWIFKSTHTLYYTWSSVFYDVMQAVKTNSFGTGDNYLTVDLSKYFTLKKYDETSGKFKKDDSVDIIKTYAVLKFHYDENGLNKASQSLFGQIKCDRSYGMETDIDTTYWQERLNYTLTESSKYLDNNVFEFRYSEVYKGYFISLTMDLKELFAELPKVKIFIDINLESQYLIDNNINIVGIDYNAFEYCELDTFKIVGTSQTLHILDRAFFDTELKTFKYSNGLVLDISNTSFNNENMEVVVI